ncbi:MAG: toxin-antitoxin system YwqK family antitoxin, partial [Bacteroidia bacterium]
MKIKKSVLVFILQFITVSVIAQTDVNPNGFNRFYYSNGKLSSEGNLINGKPEGYWKSYHENGRLKSEGNRKNLL